MNVEKSLKTALYHQKFL